MIAVLAFIYLHFIMTVNLIQGLARCRFGMCWLVRERWLLLFESTGFQ